MKNTIRWMIFCMSVCYLTVGDVVGADSPVSTDPFRWGGLDLRNSSAANQGGVVCNRPGVGWVGAAKKIEQPVKIHWLTPIPPRSPIKSVAVYASDSRL